MRDTVAIYSGGMDSLTLVSELHDQERLHSCISFDYGQRHSKELDCALAWTMNWNIPHCILTLGDIAHHCMRNSALTEGIPSVPEGHYAEESMKQTVVPNRNAIMLSIAIGYAVSHKLNRVCFGAHAGDHTIYPDCRPEFVSAINTVALLANWHPVTVEAPYLTLTKKDILVIGEELDVDYSKSWTCYKGGAMSCGKCGSCQERLAAFAELGEEDPLPYETRVLIPKEAAL